MEDRVIPEVVRGRKSYVTSLIMHDTFQSHLPLLSLALEKHTEGRRLHLAVLLLPFGTAAQVLLDTSLHTWGGDGDGHLMFRGTVTVTDESETRHLQGPSTSTSNGLLAKT